METSGLVLTPDQQGALAAVLDWYNKCRLESSANALKGVGQFRLGGFAGTGKTTLIRWMVNTLRGSVAVCAFTGKAAFVLKKKGINASTIHSLIYEPVYVEETKEMKFVLKGPEALFCDLIIVDEASMVSHQLYHDLKSFRKPILFVGDPGQLEPIGDNPNLLKETDYTIKEVLRQALDSPIVGLATAIRKGGSTYDPRKFGSKEPELTFSSKRLTAEQLYAADQIITARNITRTAVNDKFRADKHRLKFDGLGEGEKLICLKNDATIGVFNGQIMYVKKIIDERPLYYECHVETEGIEGQRTLNIWSEPFYRVIGENDRPPKEVAKCDFGYCITCHKAQGSEWDNVLVVDEWMGRAWDMARWRYTAVTRAAKKLTYAI